MDKLEKAKEIIKENYKYADCGIFNTRNIAGDSMETIYEEWYGDDDVLIIDICYGWAYFEVFGLSEEEFDELEEYYETLAN